MFPPIRTEKFFGKQAMLALQKRMMKSEQASARAASNGTAEREGDDDTPAVNHHDVTVSNYSSSVKRLSFAPRFQYLGRETGGCLPTHFDCNLGWVLGHVCGAL